MPQLSTIEHKYIKTLVPPGAQVWKVNKSCELIGHLKPRRAASISWAKHGEHAALKLVLQHVWTEFLDMEGIDTSECFLHGLFKV